MYNATVKTTFSDFGVIAVFLYDATGLPLGIASFVMEIGGVV